MEIKTKTLYLKTWLTIKYFAPFRLTIFFTNIKSCALSLHKGLVFMKTLVGGSAQIIGLLAPNLAVLVSFCEINISGRFFL